MLKAICIISIFVLVNQNSIGQKNGLFRGGGSLFFASSDLSGANTFVPAISLWPEYRFYQKRNFSLSVGAPVSIGLTYSDANAYFGADIPGTLDLNFGCNASDSTKSKFGFMMGGGLGYFYSYNEESDGYGVIDRSYVGFFGQLIHCGFIFRLKNKADPEDDPLSVMIRLSYMTKYPSYSKNVVGIGLIFALDD